MTKERVIGIASRIEREIADEFSKLHIESMQQFVVPGRKECMLDFYIISPIRSFIEIKIGKFSDIVRDRTLDNIKRCLEYFNGEIIPILVVEEKGYENVRSFEKKFPMIYCRTKIA